MLLADKKLQQQEAIKTIAAKVEAAKLQRECEGQSWSHEERLINDKRYAKAWHRSLGNEVWEAICQAGLQHATLEAMMAVSETTASYP